ncbi:MAG: YqgE/AlgH family protein [Gammaproteobacteria bacterium]|nr:YqgE/AlgH family protein [Gammaproteobacteria bacterium]|tara:strand:+ start:5880 stop:6476 length:597 start_codon:yes stop_codon:yes gene_type:complete
MTHESDTDTGDARYLENHFLIAMPHLRDPNFNGSVTYLWKHDSEGALGLVVNRPSKLVVPDLMEELGISIKDEFLARLQDRSILTGGPVERNKGFILHEAGTEWDYTLAVNDSISLSMSKDILQEIADGGGPARYLVTLGCAGWDAGQLEQEITDNVWLTVPADTELLFSTDYENKASAVAALLGVSMSQLASLAGHS